MTADLDWYWIDAETYFDAEYSIRKMDPVSYILDPRFELLMLGVIHNGGEPFLIDGPDVPAFLKTLPPNAAVCSHNALFDMSILSWLYNYRPRLIVDTVSMARTLLGHIYRRVDLGTLAGHYGLTKGDALNATKGMTREEIIEAGLWDELATYCLQDVAICRTIALDLIPQLPPEELVLQDMVARCAVDPALRLDTGLLAQHHGEIIQEKDLVLAHAMQHGLASKDQLMSNNQFADLLQSKGVTPPRKTSPTTDEQTWAFSKKDPQFLELLNHPDPGVQALVEARLTFKSTIEETRTARMLNIASLEFPHHGGTNVMPIPLVVGGNTTRRTYGGSAGTGIMPIPLMVGAAHTHRLGGGWQLNAQNWGRNSPIRKAILAPPGHMIVAADSSQIEARMNAWFCREHDLVDQFRKGEDVYATFASEIYGFPVNKNNHPRERRIGKTGILQLGYQSGWKKFKDTLWVDTFNDPAGAVEITDDEAKRVVSTYRKKYQKISNRWSYLHDTGLPLLAGQPVHDPDSNGKNTYLKLPLGWPCAIFTTVNGADGKYLGGEVIGPTGLKLYYHNLRKDETDDEQWIFDYANSTKNKLYGGKLLENIIQFLARCVVMSAAVRLKKPLEVYSSRLTHSSHDEIVYIVPNEHVDIVTELIRTEMTRSPAWAEDLPLACEIGIAHNYGDAK